MQPPKSISVSSIKVSPRPSDDEGEAEISTEHVDNVIKYAAAAADVRDFRVQVVLYLRYCDGFTGGNRARPNYFDM